MPQTGIHHYKSTTLMLGQDGIIYCRAVANDSYDEKDLTALREKIEALAQGDKVLILMEMVEFEILLTKEARIFMGNDERSAQLTKAEAVVLRSTTLRILFNLIMMVNQPKFPFKAFNSEEKAVQWLLSHN